MRSKVAVLEETAWLRGQSVTARRLVVLGDSRVRLTVRSGEYKFQSFARADVWSPSTLTWNRVYEIPFEEMSTPEGLSALDDRGLKIDNFCLDFLRLLGMTQKIIL